jgi:hypothetical protein
MRAVSVALASFLFLAQLEHICEGAVKLSHEVSGQPVRVEVQDMDNPSVIKRFNLEKGESKALDLTGLRCKVKVFTKGQMKLMVEGEFTSNQSLTIQQNGSKWVLKRVY